MIETRIKWNISLYVFIATIASFLISLFLFQLFAAMLIIFWLVEKSKNKSAAYDNICRLFLIFIVVRVISVVFSEFFNSSVHLFYKDAIFFLSFFAMSFYSKLFDEKKRKIIAFAFVIAAMVVAVVGLVKFNLGLVHRAESFSSGYMAYSTYLLAALGFGVLLYNFINEKKFLIVWSAGTGLIIAGIIVSLGRTNIALAVIVVIVSLFFLRVNKWFSFVAVLLTAVIVVISFQTNSKELNNRVEQPTVMSDRDIIWGNAKEIILKFEKPLLGYGPRTFSKIFTKRELLKDKGVNSWHNDYLQLYLETGLLGLLSYLALVFYSLFVSIKYLFKKKASLFEKILLTGSIISITALLLSAVTSGFINSPVIPVVLALFLAIISAIVYPAERVSDRLIAKEEQ